MAVLLAKLHEHSRKRPRAALTTVPLAYIERLLALLRRERIQKDISPTAPSAPAPAPALLDPLTERELEALRLLAAGRSPHEAAPLPSLHSTPSQPYLQLPSTHSHL